MRRFAALVACLALFALAAWVTSAQLDAHHVSDHVHALVGLTAGAVAVVALSVTAVLARRRNQSRR